MNRLVLIPIVIGIGIISALLILPGDTTPVSEPVYTSGFTYYDIEEIQNMLLEDGIVVSVSTAITDHTVGQYCTYLKDDMLQTVQYCTTTAVLDSEGNSLGNINLGGDTVSPVMAVANLQTSTIQSNQDDVYVIFETMIETLVCDCWEEQKSEYESVSTWLEATHTFYSDSGRNIKSTIENLGEYDIILEITSKDDHILQTLLIVK